MFTQLLADKLYWELLLSSMLLLIILLVNNLVLYRQKLSSYYSIMLICAAVMSLFEILWSVFDDHVELSALIYLCAGVYTMALLNFAAFFNRYFLERFGILMRKKWLIFLCYGLPNIVIFILCATTPWTHLFLMIDEAGLVTEMPLYTVIFYGTVWAYSLSALGLAVRYLFSTKDKNSNLAKIAGNLIIFAVLLPVTYIMQELILGDEVGDYLAMSLTVSVSLVYLTANVNIHSLMESRAHMEAVEADLRTAARIQSDVLPPNAPVFTEHPEISLRASLNTAKEVGGDFYDFYMIDDDHLGLVIADVSGKGIPAALFMAISKTLIKSRVLAGGDPATVLTVVNDQLIANNEESDMFVTVWLGILTVSTGKLTMANAGHEYPAISRSGGEFKLEKTKHGTPLGYFEDVEYWNEETTLKPGDMLFQYTDGVTEAHNAEQSLFGEERMVRALNEVRGRSPEEVLDHVKETVDAFVGDRDPFDDLTMLAIRLE